MMEVRKRPASPDNLGPSPKKRIISASDWSKPISVPGIRPAATEDDDEEADEEIAADRLERFRKEAIFRRMRHYARLQERAERKAEELQAQLNSRDVAVAAVDGAWNQLVHTVQTLGPNTLPQVSDSSLDIFNILSVPTSGQPEPSLSQQYQTRLQEVAKATQTLLSSFLALAPNLPPPDVQSLQNQNAALQLETQSIRSESRLLRSKVMELEEECADYKAKLAASENRVLRARSETVVLLESKIGRALVASSTEEGEDKKPDLAVLNGSTPHPNGITHETKSSDDDYWKTVAEGRESEIMNLSKELADAKNEMLKLKVELQDPTGTTVAETLPYKKLLAAASRHKASEEELGEQLRRLQTENLELKATQLDFQRLAEAEFAAKIEEHRVSVDKLQTDANRLRGARDALQNELALFKQKTEKHAAYIAGLKSANSLQKDRIESLVRETQRLRAALAVEVGDEDFYQFVLKNPEEKASYVSTLKAELKEASARISGLQKTLDQVTAANSDMKRIAESEADLRKSYTLCQERLATYERVYGSGSGSGSNVPSEPGKLVELVAKKEEEIRALKSLKRQEDERTHGSITAMDDLCRQIEDLIAAKDKQMYDFAALEEKVNRSQAEKSKAESKYFSAMRMKDAVEAECKTVNSAMQKQLTRIDMLQGSEQALKQQINTLERFGASAKQELQELHRQRELLEEALRDANVSVDLEVKRNAEFERELQERQQLAETRRHQLRKLEEDNAKLKKDLARAESRVESAAPRQGSPSDLSKENQNLLKLLKCSTCTNDFRSHVITKCMHTFCKSCIDARLTTRQRKCPACQAAFAVTDVQPVWFQ